MAKEKLIFTSIIAAVLLSGAAAFAQDSADPQQRAREIVSQLAIEEKVSLMMNASAALPHFGIPAYEWWNEALHGVGRNGSATTFPQPIGLAATFDDSLIEEVFTVVSDEARVKNRMAVESGHVARYQGLTFWTPNINIFRDPRWGRGMETYGEDPYLTSVMGLAVVRGLQGPADAPVLKAHACAKHFAVHSGPEYNRHSFDARVSERDFRETYLPAFKSLVTEGGVREIMMAYNRFRGVPSCANGEFIDKIIKGEWGYDGIIVTDCGALDDFYFPDRHGYCPDAATTAAAALKAGINVECGSVFKYLSEAVARGLVTEAEIDERLIPLLVERIRLGELDGIVPSKEELPDSLVECRAHRDLALKAARESMVLLKNDGILPLASGTGIALVGPNADDAEMMWGNYNPVPVRTVTLRDALQERVPGLPCFKGCDLVASDTDEDGIGELLESLEGIDVVVFAGGISPRVEGEEMPVDLPGFRGGDRTVIELPEVQRNLISSLAKAGKKVILVNFSGSAVALSSEAEVCSAILQSWYPGQEGGTAIADVLYGDFNPSGRLPVTFYAGTDQLPDYEDYAMSSHGAGDGLEASQGRTYRYFEGEPLYPFGYGLSYTSFKYGKAKVKDGCLTVPVRNVGRTDGAEVVQLYVSRPTDEDGPIKTLRAFRRVEIPAGGKVEVSIPLDEDVFLWWDESAGEMVPGAGEFLLHYGSSSASLKTLKVTAPFAAD